jgi:hypothetical protein
MALVGTIMPMQFGPTTRIPLSRDSTSSSSCRARPTGPISAKPVVITTQQPTPASAHARQAAIRLSVGTARIATSTTTGASPMLL